MLNLTTEQKEQLKTALQNQLAGFTADTGDTQVFRRSNRIRVCRYLGCLWKSKEESTCIP